MGWLFTAMFNTLLWVGGGGVSRRAIASSHTLMHNQCISHINISVRDNTVVSKGLVLILRQKSDSVVRLAIYQK